MLRDSTNDTNKRTESPTGGAARPRKRAGRRAGPENVDPASPPTPRMKVPKKIFASKRFAWTERDDYGRMTRHEPVDRVALAIARADASVALPSETMSTPVSTAYGRDLSKKMGEAVMAKTRRREEAAFKKGFENGYVDKDGRFDNTKFVQYLKDKVAKAAAAREAKTEAKAAKVAKAAAAKAAKTAATAAAKAAKAATKAKLAAAGAKLYGDPHNLRSWTASLRDGNGTKIVVGIRFPSRKAAAHDLDLASYALNGTTLCGTALTDEEKSEADGWSGNVPGYVLELRTARDDAGLALDADGAKLYRNPRNPGTWNASLRDGNGAKIVVGIRIPSREAAAHDLDLALYALNGRMLFGTALTAEETNEADGWSGNVPGYVLELRTARDDPGLADLKAKAIKTEAIKTEAIKTEAIKTEAIKTAGAKLYRNPRNLGTWNASLRDGNGTKIVVGIRFPSREAAAHDLDLALYALNGRMLFGTALTAEETNEADGWSGNVPGYVLELRTARDDPGLADLKAKAIKTKTKTKEAVPRKRAKAGL